MHVSLYVKNIAETVKFYTTFFGQKPNKVEDKYSKFILDEPALIISFIENKNKVQPYFGHLGFQVDSVEELKSRLNIAKSNNMVELVEEQTSCCYALQDKFWVKDPDGIAWEVYFFHEDVKFNDPHYEIKEEASCCSTTNANKEGVISDKCC
jgi:catechol 2,3-dioxygenase-like lactoylglutathione lyase family enzyme